MGRWRELLAAIDAATKGTDITREQRTLVDGAIGRVYSIADDCLKRYRAPSADVKVKVETCVLAGLIEQVLAEKRLQYKDKTEVKIDFRGDSSMKAALDQRGISNLMNNSIEAFNKGCTVSVSLASSDGKVLLVIKDDESSVSSGDTGKAWSER